MDATGMLHLLAAEPTLLPPAPADADGGAIEDRRRENHACLRCGAPADTALIADLGQHGKRWLDLCFKHFNDVRREA
ncbi:hypothetical protein EDD93_3686 [Streptomyces sp. 840.1]|uniref:hypothetical protein n=1 Tax=Streptomyces sp. 840.1 TaxID=2485152 RepID=UPI000F4A59D3|nr:hypothetical protein [Streptomyces sp. 840.1]ROQ69189.1 hypothetical protein EDD93_3686 [Streptomyces sp. 840.1]